MVWTNNIHHLKVSQSRPGHKLSIRLACAYHIQQFKSLHWNVNFKIQPLLALQQHSVISSPATTRVIWLLTVAIGFCSQKGEQWGALIFVEEIYQYTFILILSEEKQKHQWKILETFLCLNYIILPIIKFDFFTGKCMMVCNQTLNL